MRGIVVALSLLIFLFPSATAAVDVASVTVLGEGTPGALGVPALITLGPPAVDQPSFELRITDARPGAPALLAIGTIADPTLYPPAAATLWPATPLTLLTSMIDTDGRSLPFYDAPAKTPASLLGARAIIQGVVADPSAAGALAFTNGLALDFGIGSSAAALFDAPNALVPSDARALAVGDLDGDGRADVVTASAAPPGGSVGTLGVAIATPDGVHLPLAPVATGQSPVDLALGDLDGDGDLDAVVSHYTFGVPAQGRVSVHLGAGDGTLGPAMTRVVGQTVGALALADVTDDGVLDVLATRANAVATFPGLGDGSFGDLLLDVNAFSGTVPENLAAADLDGDARADLVLTDPIGFTHVLGGLGDGTFDARQQLVTGGIARDVALADLDADGALDLVVVHAGSTNGGTTVWCAGLGDGTFAAPVEIAAVSPGEAGLAVGDVHGDGIPDVVVTQVSPIVVYVDLQALRPGGFAVIPGLGGGAFGAPESVDAGHARALALADVDADGDLDVASLVENGDVVAFTRNPGDGAFATPAAPPTPSFLTGAAIDVDLDGIPDLIGAYTDADGVLGWRRGLGDGTFDAVATIATGLPSAVLAREADVTGDGVAELLMIEAVSGLAPDRLHVLVARGPADYDVAATLETAPFVLHVEVGDVDGDGTPDLALVVNGPSLDTPIQIWLGDGTGDFALASTIAPAPQEAYLGLALGDVTGDGLVDLVTTPAFGAGLVVQTRPGLGDGTFGAPLTSPLDLVLAHYPRLVDLDADGVLDLVVTGAQDACVLTARGVGDGTFEPGNTWPTARTPFVAAVADFDGNGALDLVVSALEAASVSVHLGFGDGTFAPGQPFAAASLASAARPVDLDLDGDLDLLVGCTGTHAVLLNRATDTR